MILRTAVDVLILTLSGGIVVVHLVLYAGVVKVSLTQWRVTRTARAAVPTVSVVVPARDEEANLPRLLSSLDRQTVTNFQLVLINDRSSDRTSQIMRKYADKAGQRVTVVELSEGDIIDGINPKQNALAHGTRRCSGDLILFTDSDCEVPPTWIADVTARYADPKLGLVIGAITTMDNGGIVPRFHAFDHIFKYGYTAGSAGIGMATGGFGNNLSIRRKALDDVGGFESLGYSTTEDAALIAAVRTRTDWKVGALISRRTLVHTTPFKSLDAVANQEVRWHIGGLFSEDLNTRFSYGYLMLFLTTSIVAIPFIALLPELAVMPATSFVTMGLMALLAGSFTRRPLRFWLWFPANLCFTMVFNSYLTIRALVRPRVTWKGRTLS